MAAKSSLSRSVYQQSSDPSESAKLETEGSEYVDYAITARKSDTEVEIHGTPIPSTKGVSLQKSIPAKTAKVTVQYSIEYSCGDDDVTVAPSLEPVSVVIPAGGSALQVMESAANSYGSQYYFTAKYYGGSLQGFDIETINGYPKSPSACYWEFLIRLPDGSVKQSKLGVSSYYFDTDGYGMIMRFTRTPLPKTIKVNYSIECHDQGEPPKPVSVSIPVGGSALQVMENAANRYGCQYYFTAKYYGGSLDGFMVETINEIPGDKVPPNVYYWEFLIKSPDGTVIPSKLGVSAYHFKEDGYGMIMRLEKVMSHK